MDPMIAKIGIVVLPFAALGANYAGEFIKNKMSAKKGLVSVVQINKINKYEKKGFGTPTEDGFITIRNKKTKTDDKYPYNRSLTYINKFGCPEVVYTPSRSQIDIYGNKANNLQIDEFGSILANVHATAISSFRKNENLDKLQKWLPLILSGGAILAIWYYCKDVPQMFEIVQQLLQRL